MTPPLRIERRSMGIYPYLFYAGDYFWPITPALVKTLKEQAHDPPDVFAKHLIDQVGLTRYLRQQLNVALSQLEDRDGTLRAFQQTLLGL